MTQRYVSINAHVIRANARDGTDLPPIRIARSRSDRKPVYARDIEFAGRARLIYDRTAPILKCGARMVLVIGDGDSLKVIR